MVLILYSLHMSTTSQSSTLIHALNQSSTRTLLSATKPVHSHLHSHEAPATSLLLLFLFCYQPPSHSTVTSTPTSLSATKLVHCHLHSHEAPATEQNQSSTILLSATKPLHCHLHSHFAISCQATPLSPPLPFHYQPPSWSTVTFTLMKHQPLNQSSTPTSLSAAKPVHCHLHSHFAISHQAGPLSPPLSIS